jgi:hypothetical protein
MAAAIGGKSAAAKGRTSTCVTADGARPRVDEVWLWYLHGDEAMAGWIKRAIKHPGALTAAASRHGISKKQEAEKESHSSNPHIRARGNLGKRFMRGGDLHR